MSGYQGTVCFNVPDVLYVDVESHTEVLTCLSTTDFRSEQKLFETRDE